MDYKTIVFSADSAGSTWKKWTKNLYVPETPFANILQLADESGSWQIINYEVNQKNIPYLRKVTLEAGSVPLASKMNTPGNSFLFYKSNAILLRTKEIATLYYDPEKQQSGLALIKW